MAKWEFDFTMNDKGVASEDMVEKPAHYQGEKIECIEYLKDNMPYEAYLGYLEGNAKKYLHRWRFKGKPVEDLKKAIWYLNRLVVELDGK
jgi:hypothetical protein